MTTAYEAIKRYNKLNSSLKFKSRIKIILNALLIKYKDIYIPKKPNILFEYITIRLSDSSIYTFYNVLEWETKANPANNLTKLLHIHWIPDYENATPRCTSCRIPVSDAVLIVQTKI